MRALSTRSSAINLRHVMYIQRRSVRIALQNFTAVEDVQQIPIISMETSMMFTIWGVSFKGNVLNVQS